MSVRNDPSVQSGGTSLLSGALLIGAAESREIPTAGRDERPGSSPFAPAAVRGALKTRARRQTLEQVTQAPVTFIPETDAQNPVSAKPRHTFAQTVGNFFRRMIRPAAAVALGATLLLAGGCASVRQGGLHPAGVPVAQGSVRIADDQVKISDFDVRLRIQNMNRTIMNSGTPAMGMITRSEHVRQTVGGDYKKNIIPEFVVEKAANGKFVAVFLLPVSGHVGDTRAEQQENARHYGEIDRHKIWIKYPDGSTKVLAQNLDPKGELTHAIRLEIELPKGKSEIIFSPLPDGRPELTCHDHRWPVDPDGFGPGRRQIYNVE